jgi:hypothetical protein
MLRKAYPKQKNFNYKHAPGFTMNRKHLSIKFLGPAWLVMMADMDASNTIVGGQHWSGIQV